jgi:hypothetical protein
MIELLKVPFTDDDGTSWYDPICTQHSQMTRHTHHRTRTIAQSHTHDRTYGWGAALEGEEGVEEAGVVVVGEVVEVVDGGELGRGGHVARHQAAVVVEVQLDDHRTIQRHQIGEQIAIRAHSQPCVVSWRGVSCRGVAWRGVSP